MKTGKNQEEEKDLEKEFWNFNLRMKGWKSIWVGNKCPVSNNTTDSSQVLDLEVNYIGNKLPNLLYLHSCDGTNYLWVLFEIQIVNLIGELIKVI